MGVLLVKSGVAARGMGADVGAALSWVCRCLAGGDGLVGRDRLRERLQAGRSGTCVRVCLSVATYSE